MQQNGSGVGSLVARATAGDASAGETLLNRLAGGSAAEQAEISQALFYVADVTFWQQVLEFLGTGRWAGTAVTAPAASRRLSQALQPSLRSLFFDSPPAGAPNEARQQALLRSLSSASLDVRRVAIELAAVSADERVVEPLIATVQRSHGRVRLQAVRALGRIGDPRAVPVLIEALRGRDELVSSLARDALVAIGPPAVEPLVRTLDDVRSGEQVRWMAARALARIGDHRAIPALISHLGDPNYGVRWVCADGLANMKGEGLRAVLRALATRQLTPWLVDAAAHVLHHAQPPEARERLKPVLEALGSPDAAWATPTEAGKALEDLTAKGVV